MKLWVYKVDKNGERDLEVKSRPESIESGPKCFKNNPDHTLLNIRNNMPVVLI